MGFYSRAMCAFAASAAIGLGAAPAADAASVVRETYTGFVQNETVTILYGPGLQGPSQKYSIRFTSPGAILGGAVWEGVEHHYHWYWADGTYYGGNDDEYFNGLLTVGPSSPGSFFGRFQTWEHPYPEIETDKYGNWTENHYDHWLEMDIRFTPESEGMAYSFTISAVPEPATWAIMITGFALAGAAIRRRRDVPFASKMEV